MIKWIVIHSVSIYAGKEDIDLHGILVRIAYVQNACTEGGGYKSNIWSADLSLRSHYV